MTDSGLRGQDKSQGDLVDQDTTGKHPAPTQPHGITDRRTPHEEAQRTPERAGLEPSEDLDNQAPDGLKRERKGPYSPTRGVRNE